MRAAFFYVLFISGIQARDARDRRSRGIFSTGTPPANPNLNGDRGNVKDYSVPQQQGPPLDDPRGRYHAMDRYSEDPMMRNYPPMMEGREGQQYGTAPANVAAANNVVASYMKSTVSKIIVALAAALSSSLLFHLASNLAFSRASLAVTLSLSCLCALSCFINGDFAEFSKALGVFTLLISRRTRPAKFLLRSLKQVRSLLMLSERNPFPSDANPWKYSGFPHGAGLPFSMMNAMIGVVVTGFLTGWSVSKCIPFFPGWLGSIACAAIFGYFCTLRDSRGDSLRYIGYAVNALMSEITTTAEDVYLKEKTSIVIGKMFAFVHRLDTKYQIITKITSFLGTVVGRGTQWANRVRTDMEDSGRAATQGVPEENSDQYVR